MPKTDRAGRRPKKPASKDRPARDQDPRLNKQADASEAGGADHSPMKRALGLFDRGDYVGARPVLKLATKDSTISETQRALARSILRAMRLDPVTVWAGLASVGLAVLVVVATSLLQP